MEFGSGVVLAHGLTRLGPQSSDDVQKLEELLLRWLSLTAGKFVLLAGGSVSLQVDLSTGLPECPHNMASGPREKGMQKL